MHEVRGLVTRVDAPRRELTVLVEGVPQVFDLAPECTIHLHGERVKLRLLLPMDYAQVVYTQAEDTRTAHAISVHWWLPLSREIEEARTLRARAVPASPVMPPCVQPNVVER